MSQNHCNFVLNKKMIRILLAMTLLTTSSPLQATPYYNLATTWAQKKAVTASYLGTSSSYSNDFVSGVGIGAGADDGMMNAPQAIAFGSSHFYVSDSSNGRISRYVLGTNAFDGWIGKIETSPTSGAAGCAGAATGTFTPGWCKGGTAMAGTGDGMMDTPRGLVVDSTNDFLYVTDQNNHRINKYIASTGAFVGWAGRVDIQPTSGAAGCTSAATDTFTPGWCKGGTSKSTTPGVSTDGALNSPTGIVFDGTNLYVTDGNSRISKYTASNAAFGGWIGNIATSPTSGAAGCAGAAAGTFTPGWCKGGVVGPGTGDGMMTSATSLAYDGTSLYLTDTGNSRVSKYTASTGAFIGWIGNIATSPTSGAAGCAGAAVGTFTPGWCKGGVANSGTGDGMFNLPNGIASFSLYFFVTDNANQRVGKYNANTGAFMGWIGNIGVSATSPTACAGAAVGTLTPEWCFGGSANPGTRDGMMNSPRGIGADASGNIYVTDTLNNRINKYNSTTGAFSGALGNLATFKTWTNSNIANLTAPGSDDGMMKFPSNLYIDSTNDFFYVADRLNHRINKYRASTGAFIGWIGRIDIPPTAGAAGCAGATSGTFTPGWCQGGTSKSGTGDGMLNQPYNIFIDGSGNLYVSDTLNNRISKYNASTGAFVGWLGKLSTGSFTGSWTTGGTSVSGNGDGMLNQPRGLFIYSGTLYVTDSSNHRISKYNASTGAFVGWLGKLSTGSFTGSWTTGGTSVSGNGDGMLLSPKDLFIDGSGTTLYVLDGGNFRISKYNLSAGTFGGWIGNVASSPTGGGAGCNGATVGVVTPGWCTGGTSTYGTGDGILQSSQGIATDGAFIYATDSASHRIHRYKLSTGAFAGWIGNVSSPPAGGAANCKGLAAGKFTPGWCTGGASQSSKGNGMMNPVSVNFDPATKNLYVIDGNHRIIRYKIGP